MIGSDGTLGATPEVVDDDTGSPVSLISPPRLDADKFRQDGDTTLIYRIWQFVGAEIFTIRLRTQATAKPNHPVCAPFYIEGLGAVYAL
jgi:hypothetical protein